MMYFKIILFSVIIKFSFGISSEDECGVTDQTQGLIYGGQQVEQHEWPWSVAIFHRSEGPNFKFICGATLITRSKVITAAHCIHEKYSLRAKKVEDFELRLGAHDINKTEVNSLALKPTSIKIHPEWEVYVINYDADIAVIELEREISISKFIRPICIWERRRGQPQFSEGIVVGWGSSERDESRTENIAKIINAPVISNEQCFLDRPAFANLSSNRTFCAGNKTGQGPCTGDSGSGMYFKNNNKYYLGGIVSASLLDASYNCDVMNYAIYTEVYKFIPWLSNKKFNDKPQFELACESYKNKRPKRPGYFTASRPTSNEADIGDFPHMALLMFKYDNRDTLDALCNGFLISEKFVVTAAHCSRDPNGRTLVSVRLGSVTNETMNSDGIPIAVDIKVKNFVIHENYSRRNYIHDIGLIELEEAAQLSYFIWPACLFDKLDNSRRFWIATAHQVTLFGDVPKPYFLKIPIEEVANEECVESGLGPLTVSLTDQQMCTKTIIASFALCVGSSGAPIQLLQDNAFYVGGISSFGRDCLKSQITVCTRIASYVEWIEERVWADEWNQISAAEPDAKSDLEKILRSVFPDD